MEDSTYDEIILTQDWHPANHKSFASNNGKVGESIELNGFAIYGQTIVYKELSVQNFIKI
jgi:nicotinamidase/pyrazinamidase